MISSSKKKHYIFIDESGTSDVKSYQVQPYFTVIGLVISGGETREKLNDDFGKLKELYFGNKGYVIHNTELLRHLKTNKKINSFDKKLFVGKATKENKAKLYKAINPAVKLP